MARRKGNKANAELGYRQSLLSSWRAYGKPTDWHSDSEKVEPGKPIPPKGFFKSKRHQVLVPILIDEISNDGKQYFYRISIYANADLLMHTVSRTGEISSKNGITIPGTGDKDKAEISLVYGISEQGDITLSHSPGSDIQQTIAYIYSKILVTIDRAIERKVYELARQKGEDDARGNIPSTSTQAHLREDTVTGRSKKIRPKIRPKDKAEKSTGMDEPNGKILGSGLPNDEARFYRIRDIDNNGEAT